MKSLISLTLRNCMQMGSHHTTPIFGSSSTADYVTRGICLKNKVVLITGATSGIGKETARVLAKRGARIVLACRNKQKMDQVIKEIQEDSKNDQVYGLVLDLGSLESVRHCVESFKKLNLPLNVLICNAGVMAPPYGKTKDGFETQIGVNYLGHFVLTLLLLDKLVKSAPSRVVVLTSRSHLMCKKINFDDLHSVKKYDPLFAYAQSKLCNLFFAFELNRRLEELGVQVTCNAVHPGVAKTMLQRHQSSAALTAFFIFAASYTKSIPQAAATTCYVATAPELEGKGGLYFQDCQVAKPTPYLKNREAVRKLWELSEQITGVKFETLKNQIIQNQPKNETTELDYMEEERSILMILYDEFEEH